MAAQIPTMNTDASAYAKAYAQPPSYHDVIIVGAGVSAIATCIQLERKLGITDSLLLEKENGMGGTWYINTYPGCACDIPAPFYSYSFAKKGDWSAFHPEQPELCKYFQSVADQWDVTRRTRLNSMVVEARFDEATGLWHTISQSTKTAEGEEPVLRHYVSKLVVLALGVLSEPNEINVPGHKEFQGKLFHASKWDHSVSMDNKDVIIVGNGCTATQVIPPIAKKAKSVTQFASSKHWIAPLPVSPLRHVPGATWLVKNVRLVNWLYRALVFMVVERTFNLMRLGRIGAWWRRDWRATCIKHIQKGAPPKYWDALIPTEKELVVGCRRRIFDDNVYLPTLYRPNVELISERLDKMGPTWVEAKDGRRIHADVVVFCTGFRPALRARVPVRVFGRGGEELHDHWDTYGAQGDFAYRSTMQAHFPNMGILAGPNATTGHSSVIFTSEAQIGLMLEVFKPVLIAPAPTWRAIEHLPIQSDAQEKDAGLGPEDKASPTAEVKLSAELNDLNWITKRMNDTVFNAHCTAWYKDPVAGRVTAMHPESQVAFARRAMFPNWSDFVYTNLPGRASMPTTMPWWKWYGNRILGLGTLPTVDKNDPAIAYARPYGSIAATKGIKAKSAPTAA